MITIKIKNLKIKHPLIYKRALECQKEQGNESNENILLAYGKSNKNFNWDETKEGGDIWRKINNNDFNSFYSFYNSNNYSIF